MILINVTHFIAPYPAVRNNANARDSGYFLLYYFVAPKSHHKPSRKRPIDLVSELNLEGRPNLTSHIAEKATGGLNLTSGGNDTV